MKNYILFLLTIMLLFSCSFKRQLVYVDEIKLGDISKINFNFKNNIEIGDVLKIDINTYISEVSDLYNSSTPQQNIDFLILNGYNVETDSTINYPFLGKINVVGFTTNDLALKIRNMFVSSGQLTNPHVRVSKINYKFTVLGEVNKPGTFFSFENHLNIFQALGFAGDLLISGNRKNVKLIRQENGLRKTYLFSLNNSKIFDKPYFIIKSNDVIIVEPNYSKIKSAGFIGSPASIASISSLVLSITLLLINR